MFCYLIAQTTEMISLVEVHATTSLDNENKVIAIIIPIRYKPNIANCIKGATF